MELELIQMKVDNYLKVVKRTLEESKADQERVCLFQNLFAEPMELIHQKVAEMLRMKMEQKCESRIIGTLPKVAIKRDPVLDERCLNMEHASSEETEMTNNSMYYFDSAEELESAMDLDSIPEIENGDSVPAVLPVPSSVESTVIVQQNKTNLGNSKPRLTASGRIARPNRYWTCDLCRPSRQVNIKERKRHNITHHLETVLISSKEANFSETEFKEYCENSMKVEMMSCVRQYDDQDNCIGSKCPHCSNIYNDSVLMRYHICVAHNYILSDKLINLQKSITLAELRATQLPSSFCFSKDDTYITCNLCDPPRRVIYKGGKRHNMNYHLETLFASSKADHVSMTEFNEYCTHVLKVEVLSCVVKQGADGKKWVKCPNCSKVYTNADSSRNHMHTAHYEILARKLVELQRSTTIAELRAIKLPASCVPEKDRWKCEDCKTSFAQERSWRRHKQDTCPKVQQRRRIFKCDFCVDKTFKARHNLRIHNAKFHSNNQCSVIKKNRPGGKMCKTLEKNSTLEPAAGSDDDKHLGLVPKVETFFNEEESESEDND